MEAGPRLPEKRSTEYELLEELAREALNYKRFAFEDGTYTVHNIYNILDVI